jgi:predicted ATPase/class 3 adenylate cyclase
MPDLPGGTVTFLFTDIEGSTRLWENAPDAMRVAMARHDALMRTVIATHRGSVFKTIGDAFCAAFHTASDALNAALAAQLALNAEAWPEPVTLRVRMALHTGVPESRNNDYFGQPLNRVARLLAAGHGGQVLLSDVTHDLCRDTLPPATSLLSLGEHRLRDLARSEQIFQLLHPALPARFPSLKSLNNPQFPNNLPLQLTSFIGREKAMEAIKTLLEQTRLLTLTGAGGSGKTRLALQVAADALEQYPDGVWLVELAPLAEADLVVQSVAQVLDVREQAGQPFLRTLTEHLKSKRLLLLLDNCEHLVSACAHLVAALLRSCPSVKVLATSREALSIAGEQSYRVPTLGLPDLRQPFSPQSVSQYEAVRLFIERAMLVKPEFGVTHQNAPALAQVCCRLDGIPLAIELAAARVRSLPVEEVNARLDNRFRLLTGGNRAALPRQQTLRALIDWSYELLGEPEKRLLARLSVFAGGWTLEAAEQVCSGESAAGASIEEWEVLDLLTGLVDKSLVIADEQNDSVRYRMLETVRQYAAERLQASGENGPVRARLLHHFLALAEEAEPQLTGPAQQYWLKRLETEHDNLRAALAWCTEAKEGAEIGLRLSGALWRFWYVRGHWHEGRQHLERALARAGAQCSMPERARALRRAGALASLQGDYAAARIQIEEALRLHRELGDRHGIAASLNNLGNVASLQLDYAAARMLYEECLHLHREAEDRRGIAYALMSLGNVELVQGDTLAARRLYEECLQRNRELGDERGIAKVLLNLGNVVQTQGDLPAARMLYEECLRLVRELGDKRGIADALINMSHLVALQGDNATAQTQLRECLRLVRELGDKHGSANALELLAGTFEAEAVGSQVPRLWGAIAALRQGIGAPPPRSDPALYERHVAKVRAELGEDAFAAAWEEGHAMTWEQAVAVALGETLP